MSQDELTKAQFEMVIDGLLEHFEGDLVPTEICKNVLRHDAALRDRCHKAESALDLVSLYRDEFMRIMTLGVSDEVMGICERAVKDIARNVSIVTELESTSKQLNRAMLDYLDMRANRDNVISQSIDRESLLIKKLRDKDRQLGVLEGQLCNFHEEIDSLRTDVRRFLWLCDDHGDAHTRAKRNELLGRMGIMSYSAICADIDAAMFQQDATLSTKQSGSVEESE